MNLLKQFDEALSAMDNESDPLVQMLRNEGAEDEVEYTISVRISKKAVKSKTRSSDEVPTTH